MSSEKWYATGSSTILQTQSFTYNTAGDRTGASDPDGSYTLTYDALHRPLTVVQPFSLTLTFSYDAASNRTQVVDNKGGTFASSYDVLDRLSSRSLDTSTGDVRVDYAYTVRDRIDTVSRFTNLAGTISAGTSKSTYDPSDRLTGIAHK